MANIIRKTMAGVTGFLDLMAAMRHISKSFYLGKRKSEEV
jgi:hypothetical protein